MSTRSHQVRQPRRTRPPDPALTPVTARLRRATAFLAGGMAVGGAAGSVGLIGGGIDFGDLTAQIMDRVPWHSGVLAGSALLATVALPMTAAMVSALRRSPRQGLIAVAAGMSLLGWIVLEVAIVQTYSWMQPFCGTYGAVVAALGWRLHRLQRSR